MADNMRKQVKLYKPLCIPLINGEPVEGGDLIADLCSLLHADDAVEIRRVLFDEAGLRVLPQKGTGRILYIGQQNDDTDKLYMAARERHLSFSLEERPLELELHEAHLILIDHEPKGPAKRILAEEMNILPNQAVHYVDLLQQMKIVRLERKGGRFEVQERPGGITAERAAEAKTALHHKRKPRRREDGLREDGCERVLRLLRHHANSVNGRLTRRAVMIVIDSARPDDCGHIPHLIADGWLREEGHIQRVRFPAAA
jgi:hypothetical protein